MWTLNLVCIFMYHMVYVNSSYTSDIPKTFEQYVSIPMEITTKQSAFTGVVGEESIALS